MGISIQAIRSSFELVKPLAQDIADRFYQNLFQDYPESQALFKSVDLQKQKTALIGALVAAVDNLDNPDALTRFLLALGERHVRYGVEDIHYDWVGATLLKTFGEFLGNHWTNDLRIQWAKVYGIIAEAMQAGARTAAKPTPKLRAVHNNGQEKDTSMNQDKKSDAVLAVDLTAGLSLPQDLRTHIQKSVEATVLALVKAEVKRYFAQELKRLEKLTPEELVRWAG